MSTVPEPSPNTCPRQIACMHTLQSTFCISCNQCVCVTCSSQPTSSPISTPTSTALLPALEVCRQLGQATRKHLQAAQGVRALLLRAKMLLPQLCLAQVGLCCMVAGAHENLPWLSQMQLLGQCMFSPMQAVADLAIRQTAVESALKLCSCVCEVAWSVRQACTPAACCSPLVTVPLYLSQSEMDRGVMLLTLFLQFRATAYNANSKLRRSIL